MKLDVCLEMVFTDLPTEERIARIGRAGYKAVEFWFHDATFDGSGCPPGSGKDADGVRQACGQAGVELNNVVVNAPDGSLGGAPVDSADLGKYLERTEEVIAFAKNAGCSKAITCTGNMVAGLERSAMRANLEKALAGAAEIAEKNGFVLLLEALNTHVDHAGYYLDSSIEGCEIVRSIGSPSLKLLYDVYHMQIMEGNVIANIRRNLNAIGHFHSAGVPGRHEHFGTELNYPVILQTIEQEGYTGCFGLEYAPELPDHHASLVRVREYLQGEA